MISQTSFPDLIRHDAKSLHLSKKFEKVTMILGEIWKMRESVVKVRTRARKVRTNENRSVEGYLHDLVRAEKQNYQLHVEN